MMVKVRLGCGASAIDLCDGDEVPLTGTQQRGKLRVMNDIGVILYRNVCGPQAYAIKNVHDHGPIDLIALRAERAPKPKVVGGWTAGVPTPQHTAEQARLFTESFRTMVDIYWRHRPDATPEKWDAFDAAVDAWTNRVREHVHGPCTNPETIEMWRAARALGYGDKP